MIPYIPFALATIVLVLTMQQVVTNNKIIKQLKKQNHEFY